MGKKQFTILLTIIVCYLLIINPASSCAQLLNNKETFTRQDTLRGTITPERAWWNATKYAIHVKPDYATKTISGSNDISFTVLKKGQKMQIDLQQPMEIKSITWNNAAVPFTRDGNVYYATFPSVLDEGSKHAVSVQFEGKPVEAKRPPWDGGWIWRKDEKGRPWMSVACQGLGASVWYPCKDHQSDEPDSATLSMTVADTLMAVGNGRLRDKKINGDGTATFTWGVTNPINSYNIVPSIGKYVTWHEDYNGEKGKLDCDYWVLDYNLPKAQEQFKQAAKMLKCFEHWFGPYPFYEDGFKLVESPHLGMEHQSAVAYGNKYQNGYLGTDLSASGWGLKFDFIIIHEAGHEWFANNITTKDIADMWVHEGFTNYSETLFTECEFGKEAGTDYVSGIRKNIENKETIIGVYGVNKEGSGDMYYKGGNLLHTIRQVVGDDEKFRQILRGLNKDFYHQTVTSRQVEEYISKKAGFDLSKVFDQYLRNTQIPALEYYFEADKKDKTRMRLYFRWIDCVPGFNLPVKVQFTKERQQLIRPVATKWNYIVTDLKTPTEPDQLPNIVNRNYYIRWIEHRKIVPPGKYIRD
ncbi:MAG TPA: M1 family metallopeptidase [Chitinophagaceae bacterium]|nr:M1 family metallopeptidase [Chitinophagaceae bacterium]